MSIKVVAYTIGGKASGVIARPGHLREVLEQTRELELTDVRWQPLDVDADQPAGDLTIAIDDVLIAVTDDETAVPVHASWHALRIHVGPYVVEGELPTLPGYDPGRALARPNGEFVLLRDVRAWSRPTSSDTRSSSAAHALVNRYGVERVEADIMLGFFFPGAAMPDVDETDAAGEPRHPWAASEVRRRAGSEPQPGPPQRLAAAAAGAPGAGPSPDRLAVRMVVRAPPGRDRLRIPSGRGSAFRSGTKPSSTVHGIACFSIRWTPRSRSTSSMQTRLIASPVAPARPVRPMRWM